MGVDDGLVMRAYSGGSGGTGGAIVIIGVILFVMPVILNIMNLNPPSFLYALGIVVIIAGVVVAIVTGNDD
jgi:hypothetical protein